MGRGKFLSLLKKLSVFHRKTRIMHKIILDEEVAKEVEEEEILKAWRNTIPRENCDHHFICCNRDGHDASTCKFPWDRIE